MNGAKNLEVNVRHPLSLLGHIFLSVLSLQNRSSHFEYALALGYLHL